MTPSTWQNGFSQKRTGYTNIMVRELFDSWLLRSDGDRSAWPNPSTTWMTGVRYLYLKLCIICQGSEVEMISIHAL